MRLLNVRVFCTQLEESIRFYEALGFERANRGERIANPIEISADSDAAELFGLTEGMSMRVADLRFPGRNPGTHLQLLEMSGGSDKPRGSAMPLLSVSAEAALESVLPTASLAGGRVEMQPKALSRLGDVKVATVRDPDGNLIQLVEPRPESFALRQAARDFRRSDSPKSLAAQRQAVAIEEW